MLDGSAGTIPAKNSAKKSGAQSMSCSRLLKYGGTRVPMDSLRNPAVSPVSREILVTTLIISVLAAAAIFWGVSSLTTHVNSSVTSFRSATSRPQTTGGTSLSRPQTSNSPWTAIAGQAYGVEQSYRADQLRQEERDRQLDETRRANQQIIDERIRAQRERQETARQSVGQDFTVPLGTYTRVTLGGTSYRLAVHDDGP